MSKAFCEYERPTDHPGFVLCNDPRLEDRQHHRHLPVYVPSLVYLLHRLGGLANVNDTNQDLFPSTSLVSEDNPHHAVVVASKFDREDGRTELILTDWHPWDVFLEVHFHLPPEWATGHWEVGYVASEDRIAASDDLRREVALVCNAQIGMDLADRHARTVVD